MDRGQWPRRGGGARCAQQPDRRSILGRLPGPTAAVIFARTMVAEANKSRAAPIYAPASFRSREAVGALVALTRHALIEEFRRQLAPPCLNAAQALGIRGPPDHGART